LTSDSYTIIVTRGAERDLNKLDRPVLNRIVPIIDNLSQDPRPPGSRKLVNEVNMWRVRVGDWRVLYEISDDARTVRVIAARHRSKAYE
jgi:mRNA interferase RelE/StbE